MYASMRIANSIASNSDGAGFGANGWMRKMVNAGTGAIAGYPINVRGARQQAAARTGAYNDLISAEQGHKVAKKTYNTPGGATATNLASLVEAKKKLDDTRKKLDVTPKDFRGGSFAALAKKLGAKVDKADTGKLITAATNEKKTQEKSADEVVETGRVAKKQKDDIEKMVVQQQAGIEKLVQTQQKAFDDMSKNHAAESSNIDATIKEHTGKDQNELINVGGRQMTRGQVVQENLKRQDQIITEAQKESAALAQLKKNKENVTVDSVTSKLVQDAKDNQTKEAQSRQALGATFDNIAKALGTKVSPQAREYGIDRMGLDDPAYKKATAEKLRAETQESRETRRKTERDEDKADRAARASANSGGGGPTPQKEVPH
jgi:hypothetical protein